MRVLLIVVAAGVVGLGCTGASRPNSKQAAVGAGSQSDELEDRFLSPGELFRRIEASKVTYEVGSEFDGMPALEQSAQYAWPRKNPLAWPIRVEGRGGAQVRELRFTALLRDAMMQVERDYRERRFKDAEKGYANILATSANFLPALLGHGDAALFDGRPGDALKRYERALAVQPNDYRGHFFRGSALMALGRHDEARASYTRALALRPRAETIVIALEHGRAKALGVTVANPFLRPWGMWRTVRPGVVQLKVDAERMHWFAWTACKAYWSAEPEHRKLRTGRTEHSFSIEEELECLAVMAQAYEFWREKNELQRDPDAEQVIAVLKAGFGKALVVHEIVSRIDPHVVMRQSPEAIEMIERYVARYVLPPAR